MTMRMMVLGVLLASSPLVSAFSSPLLAFRHHQQTSATHHTHQNLESLGYSTQLRFRSGGGIIETSAQTNNHNEDGTLKWWKSMLPTYVTSPTTPQDDTSQRVDEYLKFLDKRYHQIHDEDKDKETPSLSTQKQTTEPSTTKRTQSQFMRWLGKENFEYDQSDALYALGLAANAGKQHTGANNKLNGSQSPETSPNNQAKEASADENALKTADTTRSIEATVVRVKQSKAYQNVSNARHALLRFEALKFRQFAKALLKLVKRAPSFPAWLLKAGGGRRPTAVALAVFSVVLFHVLLPAVSSFVRESLASQA